MAYQHQSQFHHKTALFDGSAGIWWGPEPFQSSTLKASVSSSAPQFLLSGPAAQVKRMRTMTQ